MGSHYLVDNFYSPLANSPLIDVRTAENGQSPMNGSFIINVPDGVPVKDPVDLNDLLTQKYAGLLSSAYAGFTEIVYEDALDATSFNNTPGAVPGVQGGTMLGERQTIIFPRSGSQVTSTVIPLAFAPEQAVVTWEVYEVVTSDPGGGLLERTYVERPASHLTVQVTCKGAPAYINVTDGAVYNIAAPNQGDQLIVRMINNQPTRRYLGSWAVIY